MNPVASLDRLTIVGDVDGAWRSDRGEARGDFAYVHEICESVVGPSAAAYPYQYAYNLTGGGYVAFARGGARVPAVRIDLNPNKLDADSPVRAILDLLFDTRCTRLDVAVDYPDKVVGEWAPIGRSGKRFTVQARNGRVETQMVGARSSARQLVVYDKVADCKAKKEPIPWGCEGPLMRVEARQRLKPADGSSVLSPDMMDDVELLDRGATFEGLKLRDRAMLEYLARHPEARGELLPDQRRRLDSLAGVQAGSTIQPSPSMVYREHLPALREQYFATLGGGGGGGSRLPLDWCQTGTISL